MVGHPFAGHQNLFMEHAGLTSGLGENKLFLKLGGSTKGNAVRNDHDNADQENEFYSQAHLGPLKTFHTRCAILLIALHKLFLTMTLSDNQPITHYYSRF